MKYIVDIDNTICFSINSDYPNCIPITERIKYLNKLYEEGHEIHYWTARGANSGKDWKELTINQLNDWGVKRYSVSFGKPAYDIWIDDKAINSEDFFHDINNRN